MKMHKDTDNGWIKSSDELPDENVGVFVFIPEEDDHVTTGMWDCSKKWVLLDEYRVPMSEITHWRPYNFELPANRTFKKTEGLLDEENSKTDKVIMKLRNEVFRLSVGVRTMLDRYSLWLCKNGYMDTDWRDEDPGAIDEFMKTEKKLKGWQ